MNLFQHIGAWTWRFSAIEVLCTATWNPSQSCWFCATCALPAVWFQNDYKPCDSGETMKWESTGILDVWTQNCARYGQNPVKYLILIQGFCTELNPIIKLNLLNLLNSYRLLKSLVPSFQTCDTGHVPSISAALTGKMASNGRCGRCRSGTELCLKLPGTKWGNYIIYISNKQCFFFLMGPLGSPVQACYTCIFSRTYESFSEFAWDYCIASFLSFHSNTPFQQVPWQDHDWNTRKHSHSVGIGLLWGASPRRASSSSSSVNPGMPEVGIWLSYSATLFSSLCVQD